MKTKQNRGGFGFAAALSLCALIVTGCSKPTEPPPAVTEGSSPGASVPPPGRMQGGGPGGGMRGRDAPLAESASGAEVYQAKCGCHGPEGKGGRAPVLTSTSSRSDDDLYKIIHDGRDKMPAFGTQLSEAQIKKVVTYIKTLKS